MNYLIQYTKIIRNARRENAVRKMWSNLGNYYEDHHIYPKCILIKKKKPKSVWNGKWNHVLLTAREHFIVHLLLWNASKNFYGNNHQYTDSMFCSVDFFRKKRNENREKYKITSRIYEILKKEFSRVQSKRIITKATRQKMRLAKLNKIPWNKGLKMPKMTGELHPNWNKIPSNESKEKNKISHLGKTSGNKNKKHPELSKAMIGKGNHMYNRTGKNNPSSKKWGIYRSGGRYDETDDLKQWCLINGYGKTNIYAVFSGTRKFHKDIVHVEQFD